MTEPTLMVDSPALSQWVPMLIPAIGAGPLQQVEVDAWAAEIAREVLRIRGITAPSADELERAASMLAAVTHQAARMAQAAPTAMSWALMPAERIVAHCLAALRPVAAAPGAPPLRRLDDVIGLLVAEPADRFGDPDVETQDTASGTAARVVQRIRVPADELTPPGALEEWVAYCWWLPEADLGFILSVTFPDLVEGGRWRPDCDELARSLHLHLT